MFVLPNGLFILAVAFYAEGYLTSWSLADNGALEFPRTVELARGLEDASLGRRDVSAGGACGTSAGNAVCAAGLCCSAAGVCGTGGAFCSGPDCQLSFGPACDGNQIPSGKDTSNVPRPKFGSVPYGVSISHCTVNGKVALTFDDGPYIYTTDMLDLLKKNDVKATFFIVGNNGGKGQIEQASSGYPPIIQRMYAEGHQIGSHSWSHQDMSLITAQQRHDQIIRNEMAFVDILGFIPTYFRPPYTNCPDSCLQDLGKLGYHVANYDIDTRDWQGNYTYAQNTYSSILVQHSPASSSWISLAHDIQPNTVHGFAQYMIDQAKSLGYQLVRLGDCLGDPEANWYRDPTSGAMWGGKAATSPTSPVATSSSTKISSPTSTTTLLVPTTTTSPISSAMTSALLTLSSIAAASSARTSKLKSSTEALSSSSATSTSSSVIDTASITPTPVTAPGNFGGGATATSSSVGAHSTTTSVSSNVCPEARPSAFGLLLGVAGLFLLLI